MPYLTPDLSRFGGRILGLIFRPCSASKTLLTWPLDLTVERSIIIHVTIRRHEEKLHAPGEEARRLTLKKAYAYMLLKWRGHDVPSPEELQSTQ